MIAWKVIMPREFQMTEPLFILPIPPFKNTMTSSPGSKAVCKIKEPEVEEWFQPRPTDTVCLTVVCANGEPDNLPLSHPPDKMSDGS